MNDRKKFVEWLSPKLLNIIGDIKYDIRGVSIVPIDRHHFKNNPCIVLGKERAGIYKNEFNYFGGKAESYSDKLVDKCRIVAETLFDETLEELGLILNENFEKCNPYIISHKGSILFLAFIKNLDKDWWLNLMQNRRVNPFLNWKYQEMSEIEFIPIVDILNKQNEFKISNYVKETIDEIVRVFAHSEQELTSWEVSRKVFKDTRNLSL